MIVGLSGSQDPMYGEIWINGFKFANTLKLKLLVRQTEINGRSYFNRSENINEQWCIIY